MYEYICLFNYRSASASEFTYNRLTINDIKDFFEASGKNGKTKKISRQNDNLLYQYRQLSCSLSRSSANITYKYSCRRDFATKFMPY